MDNLSHFPLFSRRSRADLAFNGFFLFLFLQYPFLCPCQSERGVYVLYCVFHMLLPALLCFFFSVVLNGLRGGCGSAKLCCAVFLRALCMGVIWVILVFYDGDWYVCLMTRTDKPDDQQLPCKKESDLSQKEKSDVRYDINVSRVIAMVLTLVMVTIWLCCTATQPKATRRRNHEEEDEEENHFL